MMNVTGSSKNRNSRYKRKLREKLHQRAQGKCATCGKQSGPKKMTIDHIIPLSRGGTWIRENLQLMCRDCNQKKGSQTTQEALNQTTQPEGVNHD